MDVDTVSIAAAVKRRYIQSPTLCCPCHKVNRLSGWSRCPFPLDLSLHLPEPCKTVGPVVLWELSLLCVIWPAEGRKPTQTVNNERLLAFETEQAKRNTKHSSERTVITHKAVSALLEGLLLCVNDLSCLWRSALWLQLWLLKSCNHGAEGNKDVIYGWFHNRWLSRMTLSPSHKSIALCTFCTFWAFHARREAASLKEQRSWSQTQPLEDRLPDFSISFCCDSHSETTRRKTDGGWVPVSQASSPPPAYPHLQKSRRQMERLDGDHGVTDAAEQAGAVLQESALPSLAATDWLFKRFIPSVK